MRNTNSTFEAAAAFCRTIYSLFLDRRALFSEKLSSSIHTDKILMGEYFFVELMGKCSWTSQRGQFQLALQSFAIQWMNIV